VIYKRSVGLLWKRDQPFAETSTYTSHNILKNQTFMSRAGFEPVIPTVDRPQTYTLDRAATDSGVSKIRPKKYINAEMFISTISDYLYRSVSANKR